MHEIEIIVNFWLQSLGTWLAIPMQVFSFLGTQNAYILIMSWLYWCVDNQMGIRVGVALLLSNGLNTAFKWIFHSPRPYWINPALKALSVESSFGIPSGHAMISISVWGRIVMWVKKSWFTAVISVMLFLIGFSRIYLGVHFLSDVVAGWLFGISLLIILSRLEKPIAQWFNKLKFSTKIILDFLSSLLIIVIFSLLLIPFNQWQVPESWIANSQIASPGSIIDPLIFKDIILLSGTWFGLISGFYWMREMGGFNSNGKTLQKVIRFLLGFAGVIILVFGIKGFLPLDESWFSYTLIYFQYFLVSLWISAIAPLLFIKTGLADKKTK
jgi:membrane-associated phospholipid phosphatase